MWDAIVALAYAPFIQICFVLFWLFVGAVGYLDWMSRR